MTHISTKVLSDDELNCGVTLQNGGAKDGFDMNVAPAWQKGYTGKGVVVSILDDGIQTNHPDLALNYVSTHVVPVRLSGTIFVFLRYSEFEERVCAMPNRNTF
jgi:subtilisin family serine protease